MKVANDKVRTHLQAGRQFQAAKVRDTSVRAVEPSGRNRQEPGKERAPLQRSRGRGSRGIEPDQQGFTISVMAYRYPPDRPLPHEKFKAKQQRRAPGQEK